MTKRISGRLAAIIAVCCLLLTMFSFTASAEGGGTLTYQASSVAEGVGVDLIKIGSIENGNIVFDPPFSFVNVERLTDGNSSEAMDAAMEIADIVRDFDEYMESAQLQRLNYEGAAHWKSIETDAVYIIIQHDGQGKCKIQPSVFTSPMIVDGEVINDLTVRAKLENNADLTLAGSVVVNKLGYKDKKLPGAKFSFWEKIYYTDEENLPDEDEVEFGEDYYGPFYWRQLGEILETDENGQIMIESLPIGTYRFIEVEAPDGYLLDESAHEFDITQFSTVNVENGLYITDGRTMKIKNEVDINNPPDDYYSEGGGDEPPPPPSGGGDGEVHLTGDDIVKYVGIGVIVVLSLGAIILLVILGGKREKKDKK